MGPLVAFAGLALPMVLGVQAAAAGLFADPGAALGHLNRYALFVAFPVLVVASLGAGELAVPSGPGFWLFVPLETAAVVAIVRVAGLLPALRAETGTLALVTVFGNVAYLGLPVVERVLGPGAMGLAALVVAVHLVVSLLVGPFLLLRWSGRPPPGRGPLHELARQPLLWAPAFGLLLRWLPAAPRAACVDVLAPIGRSAAPVALFLLGMHVWLHRERVRRLDLGLVAHVGAKVALVPLLTVGMALWAMGSGLLSADAARVLVLLSFMPTAITTFALARDLEAGADRVAQAIVGSTLAAAATLPFAAWLVTRPPFA